MIPSVSLYFASVVVNYDTMQQALVTKFDSISTRKLPNTLRILSADKTMVALSDYDDHHKTLKRNVLTSVLGPAARVRDQNVCFYSTGYTRLQLH